MPWLSFFSQWSIIEMMRLVVLSLVSVLVHFPIRLNSDQRVPASDVKSSQTGKCLGKIDGKRICKSILFYHEICRIKYFEWVISAECFCLAISIYYFLFSFSHLIDCVSWNSTNEVDFDKIRSKRQTARRRNNKNNNKRNNSGRNSRKSGGNCSNTGMNWRNYQSFATISRWKHCIVFKFQIMICQFSDI